MSTHSERLCSRIELALPTAIGVTNAFINHSRIKELFPEFLLQTHWMVRNHNPMLEFALQRCREIAPSDPVAKGLAPYYEVHIEEERNHDEWLLQDLELLGYSRADLLRRLPSPAIAMAEGGNLYWALHHHPIAVMGPLIASECYPFTLEMIDFLQQETGYPRAAFRTMELHSELDKVHGREAFEMLDSLPLDDWHHEVLSVTALNFLAGSTQMYRELLDEFVE